jgi:CO/xanthine dehydrogenase Mo-binding subunit
METKAISRRDLLKGTGALVVSFSLFEPAASLLAQSAAPFDSEPEATSLDSWLAIAPDGSVVVYTSKVDLGTGVETSLAQIVAEELDVPFKQVKMEMGDTTKTVDQGITAGSRTIERAGPQLRQAAAVGRQELLKLASARLEAPVDKLMVNDGVVSVMGSPAKKVSYGSLIGGKQFHVQMPAAGTGWDLKVAPDAHVKAPKDYKIVGKSVPRVDLPPKFTGEFPYTPDFRTPGMLHGRVVRPATVVAKPASIDQDSIKDIPGVVKVVQDGSFVGVVAETEWAAIQAAKALKVTWSTPGTMMPASADEVYDYLNTTHSFRDVVALNRGDAAAAVSKASRKFEATYRWPFQMHGMLAPSCAVADVRGDKVTIWAASQGSFLTRTRVAAMLGVPEKNVHFIYRENSGCYGRLGTDDAAEDAVVMSRAVGKPVRVQWMREDEHGWEPKGPAQLLTVHAGMDDQGKIIAWDYLDRSFPWTESTGIPLVTSRQVGVKLPANLQGAPNGTGGGGDVYSFENSKIIAAQIPWLQPDPTPLRTCPLRAPGDLARVFASESFIDEIAASNGVDPVEFRLRYLDQNQRAKEALQAAAKRASWSPRPSPSPAAKGSHTTGRGIALTARSTSVVVAIAEVEVDKPSGKVVVHKVTVAHDCGLIINPGGLKNQIEGNVIQGTSRSLLEEVKYDISGIKTLDWKSYPILKFEEIPDVDIVLLDRPEMPALGGGEPSIGPIPAAIANAIFDATGARLREAPFTPQRVLSALRGAAPPVQLL